MLELRKGIYGYHEHTFFPQAIATTFNGRVVRSGTLKTILKTWLGDIPVKAHYRQQLGFRIGCGAWRQFCERIGLRTGMTLVFEHRGYTEFSLYMYTAAGLPVTNTEGQVLNTEGM